MHTALLQNLSAADVAAVGKPVILYVKSSTEADKYDHYVLCLGAEDGQLRILDAPHSPRLMPTRELARRWGGVGLVVSADPLSNWAMLSRAWASSAGWTMAAVVAVTLAGWGLKRFGRRLRQAATWRARWGSAVSQAAGVCALALLGSVCYHLTTTLGLLANPQDVASIQETRVMSFAKTLGTPEVETLMKGGAVVVDARARADFDGGHIPGAINIPANRRAGAGKVLAGRVAKNAKIILYCQSAGCPFSKQVGTVLWREGYRNLYVFRGGWEEWEAAARSAERS